MMNSLHEWELNIIQWFAELRTPPGDAFFRFMNFFDRPEFYLILFPLVWYGFSKKWGIRLFFWLMFSSICNFYFKNAFGQPRPYELNAALGLITVHGYGLPSGAAQSSLFLVGAFIQSWRTRSAWTIGIAYLFLICLSRVYLGVHFPSDVLGGLLIGCLLLLVFFKLSTKIENWIAKKPPFLQLVILTTSVIVIYLPSSHSPFIAQQCAAIFGVALGLILASSFKAPRESASSVNAIFAVATVTGLAYLTKKTLGLDPILMTFLLGLWLSLGLPYLLSIFKSAEVLSNCE